MPPICNLLPGRLLREAGQAKIVKDFRAAQIDDALLSKALSSYAPLLTLYEGPIHGEGTAWQTMRDRLVLIGVYVLLDLAFFFPPLIA